VVVVVAVVVVGTHTSFFTNARDLVAVLSKAYVLSVAFASRENSAHSCVPVSWIAIPHSFPSSMHFDRHSTGVFSKPTELSTTRSSTFVKLARTVKNCTTPSVVPGSKHPPTSLLCVVVVVTVPVVVVVVVEYVVVLTVVVVVLFVVVDRVTVVMVVVVLVLVVDVSVVEVAVVDVNVVVVVMVVMVVVVVMVVEVEEVIVVVLVVVVLDVDEGPKSHVTHVCRQLWPIAHWKFSSLDTQSRLRGAHDSCLLNEPESTC